MLQTVQVQMLPAWREDHKVWRHRGGVLYHNAGEGVDTDAQDRCNQPATSL